VGGVGFQEEAKENEEEDKSSGSNQSKREGAQGWGAHCGQGHGKG
jgi:hypothetical protein